MGLLTQIFKGVGGAAEAAAPGVTELGKYKGQKWLLETKMGWEDLKAKKLAEATLQSSQVTARRAATELVLKEVGDQITTIENSLKGDKGLGMDPAIRAAQEVRRETLMNMRNELARAHLVDVGWDDKFVIDVLFPGRREKKDGGKDTGDEKVIAAVETLSETDEKKIAEQAGEGALQSFLSGFGGQEAQQRGRDLADAIQNIAWEDDLLLNTIKGIPGIVAEDNFIRQIIADVLGNEPQIVNAQSEEDINTIVADPGLLKTIVGKIVEFVKDPIKRKEWSGEGPAPGEDPKFMDRELKRDWDTGSDTSVPDVGWRDTAVPSGVDVAATDREQERILGTGQGLLAQADTAAVEQPYQDYAPTVPAYDAGSLTEATTEVGQSYAPAPMEPMSYNHVEGQKAGSVNITSMRIGDIAERYGYTTPIGLGFTYNQLIDIASKYMYPGSSKKEVREILDNINFTEKVQNIFMKHITEGR